MTLDELMARAEAAVEAMTPAERAHMRHEQRISFVVGNLTVDGRDPISTRAAVVREAGPCPCGVCGAVGPQVPTPRWEYGSAPRGVRLLVTARAPGGGLSRIYVATLSHDHDDNRWFSEGRRIQGVIAWMFLPPEAKDPQ